jgi:hypothetical protein
MDLERPELEPLWELFPLKLGSVEIDLVDERAEAHHANPDEIWAPVRVIRYEPNGWVRDILQQDVRLAPHPNLLVDRERVQQCIAAHVEVLTEVFARPRGEYDNDSPAELLFIDELLVLRKASTREQFAAALRARKRLGRRLEG